MSLVSGFISVSVEPGRTRFNNIDGYTAPDSARGCMIVLSANTGTTGNEEVREYVATFRRKTTDLLHQGHNRRRRTPTADTTAISTFFATVLHGLSIQASRHPRGN